ncbi:MAG: hypothetical protein GY742_19675 [Hyphomicrobiales bacterium]|nr:hypothetical protein [Hyphomicrobiales bacterium]
MNIKTSLTGLFLSFLLLPIKAIAQEAVDADALAKELANPGGALSSMTNKIEIRWFDGDLPDADKQHAYTYVFQPTLPFPTAGGDTFILRPAFSYLMHQPYFDAAQPGFDQATAFGDIGFDALYSFGDVDPYVFGLGLVGGIPTGTDNRITGDNWLLGPELLFARKFDWGIAGFLAFHQWKAAGHGGDFNVSSFQPLFAYSLGDGVTVGPSGTITYNWNAEHDDAWTVPIGLNIGKATTLNGKPIKYGFSVEYNVVRPDSFGPEWKVTFSIAPVVQNPFLR